MASYSFLRSQLGRVSSLALVLLASLCPAEKLSPELSPSEREPLADRFLREKLAIWQKRLQLEDWKITVTMMPEDRLRPATLGNIRWDPGAKTATIRVLHSAGYDKPFDAALRDMEFTVVHELIHLTLSRLPRTDETKPEEERAINRLATALLQRESVE